MDAGSGYDANFVDPLQEHHKCPACHLALRDPLQTVCGHRICKGCYLSLQKARGGTGDIQCPADESIVRKDEVFPDGYAKREVLSLPVYCKFRDNGCQWQGLLRQYEEHVNACDFKGIHCPNGCQTILPQHLLAKHLSETCPLRKITCEFCTNIMPIMDLPAHYDECDCYPVECLYNCGEVKIPRDELQEHLEKYCLSAEGACMYSFGGCEFKGNTADINQHLKEKVKDHLLMSAKHAVAMEAKNTELNRKLDKETNQVKLLEKKLNDQGENLRETQEKLYQIQTRITDVEREVSDMKNQGQGFKQRLVHLEQKSGPSMIGEVDKLKLEGQQMEKKVEGILRKVKENSGVVTDDLRTGPMSMSAENAKEGGDFEKRSHRLENQLALQDVQMAELNLKLQLLEVTSYDGVLVWKIDNYKRRKQDAIMGKTPSMYSPPFYTSRFGYKMCTRIYLNGDGQGRGSHLSLFFVVMKGEYDSLLKWPFPCRITMQLLAQDGTTDVVESFRPDPNSSSFRRPLSEMNVASGCPLFVSQSKLSSGPYIIKDSLYIKVVVDTSTLPKLF